MYDYEIVSLVSYFPGMSYGWLLEGVYENQYLRQSEDALHKHIQDMTEQERQDLLDAIRAQ